MTVRSGLFFLMLIGSSAWAQMDEVDFIISSKSTAELELGLQKRESLRILRERCEAELAANYLPVHCYRWMQRSGDQNSTFQEAVDQACRRSMSQDQKVYLGKLYHFSEMSLNCQRAVAERQKVDQYKWSQEDPLRLMRSRKIGRDFELHAGHVLEKSQIKNRISVP